MNLVLFSTISFSIGFISLYFVSWLKQKKQISTVYTRKLFHFLIFTTAGLIMFFFDTIHVFLFGLVIFILIIYTVLDNKNSSFYNALARYQDSSGSLSSVILPLISTAVGGAVSVLLFGKFSIIGFFVSGWADGAAEPIGSKWGTHKFKTFSWNRSRNYKSIEGSAALFLVGIIAAFLALILIEIPVKMALIIAVSCSLISTITEAISFPGTDNLTVQIIASGTAYLIFFRMISNI